MIFLGFLLLTTQVLLHLYATSTVSAAAFDAARRAAAEQQLTPAEAEGHARGLLGAYGARATVDCSRDGDAMACRITGPSPAPLVALLRLEIERTARVRVEEFR